jgi:tetratricopeptide (TPR) repeat protein
MAFILLASHAEAACEVAAAQIFSVQGTVEALRADLGKWETVKLNDTYCEGDQIRAMENGRADIRLASGAVMRLGANSSITLEQTKEKGNSVIDMIKGAAHFFSRKPESLQVKTPYAIAGVRGTEFLIEVGGEETVISIFNGAVLAQNEAGSLELGSGQSAVARKGRAPLLKTVVRPRDAVNWALYYPPLLPPDKSTGAYALTYEAQQMLAVGKVAEAQAGLAEALKQDPNSAEAYALQSIVAVVRNEKDAALELADKAVGANPRSAAALMARSYAKQAAFDLDGARGSLEEAVRVDEGNALAWARLAEVQAMFGDRAGSLASARRASALDPRSSRAQTVLGFAHLQEVEIGAAKEAFARAIENDQADPLPRLGLGLAMIREGDLEEGGGQIEIAASLDPGNSLIRSYLGKVYYEEKKSKLDGREYAVAKELDPNDPTPWFYEAVSLQSQNRPVEALQAYQKSIELNDNRAVYRSKLMLDSDEAARGVGLARIYGDLGFRQRALVEGWNAVNADPSDYSAHRFLADSYSVLPRHEIARVSELLQSQLLQPLNMTPLQPSSAESSQLLVSSLGASAVSYNEYNPILFSRNRATFSESFMAGQDETFAAEGVVSAIHDNLSLSGGLSHFETDGWRENADRDRTLVNLFAQWMADADTSLQAEYRHKKWEEGDIVQRFFADDVMPGLRNGEEADLFRFGLRRSFSPGSILLGSLMHQDSDFFLDDDQPAYPLLGVGAKGEETSDSVELQYLFRSVHADVVIGGGYFHIDGKIDTTATTDFPPPDDVIRYELGTDLRHTNLHAYSTLKPMRSLAVTLGASGDLTDGDSLEMADREEFNPKLGVTWSPWARTTLRAAAFRVMKRTLITDQTLEPTQVAGFNQFFDDINGTTSWRYGAAVDQRFTETIFGGVEASRRDLEVPSIVQTEVSAEVENTDWEEDLGRAYLFWAADRRLTLGAEYQLERFEQKDRDEFADGRFKLTSHRVPLSANVFLPSGVSASLKGTYSYQHGEFDDPTGSFRHGSDTFWVVDASLRYLLPNRQGSLAAGVKNLFDREFEYYESDPKNPGIQPERMVFGMVTIVFP